MTPYGITDLGQLWSGNGLSVGNQFISWINADLINYSLDP